MAVDHQRGGLGLGSRYERFVFVAFQPFSPRNLERFGARWLLKRGRTVDCLDVSKLVWGTAGAVGEGREDVTSVTRPAAWEEVEAFVAAHSARTLWILYVHVNEQMRPLFELLARFGVATLYFDGGRLPMPGPPGPTLRTRLRRWAGYPKRLVWGRVPRAAGRVEVGLDYYVMSGRDCEVNPLVWLRRAGITVPASSWDYVLWNSSDPFDHDGAYIVFLDQAYPDNTDATVLQVGNPLDRDVYYPQIEDFLEYTSEVFRMPVLVALHPRLSRADRPNPYRRCPAVVGRTASLVKGASLVIAHDTTAISFAVLGRKPLLLVKLDEVERSQWHCRTLIDEFARVLGASIVRVDSRHLPAFETLSVDESKYAWYEAMYIRHPACNGSPLWDRVFGAPA